MAQERPSFLTTAVIAIVVPLVVNLALFFIGTLVGAFPDTIKLPTTGNPFTFIEFTMLTLGTTIGAVIAYWLLQRFLPNYSIQLFILGSLLVYAALLIGPFGIPGSNTLTIVFLQIIHLDTLGIVLYLIWRYHKSIAQ